MNLGEPLTNKYVRNYYNKQVGGLDDVYTNSRWHSSVEREFDYAQTSRALDRALDNGGYSNAIEVGPGDAVWTEKVLRHINGHLHLVEQSDEMLRQAKIKLEGLKKLTFERSDFMNAQPPNKNDLLVAVRCFEYFTDKREGLLKMFQLLSPGGRLIIITKNADLYTTKNVQGRTVHSGQLSKKKMTDLLKCAGFSVVAVYPATIRWKARYALFRFIFDALHKFAVLTRGYFNVPFLFRYATESYTYVAIRPK